MASSSEDVAIIPAPRPTSPRRVRPVAREDGCWGVTTDRKYYHLGRTHVKRTLRQSELYIRADGSLVIRPQSKERLQNEAACLHFVRSATDVPVPSVVCEFEDDDSFYLITKHVDGICMKDLPEKQRMAVEEELKKHRQTLWSLRSSKIGGPTGLVITPERIAFKTEKHDWALRNSSVDEFVFCHNDYSQQNIIVDPVTLKINAILDWEFAGFYPRFFDRPWYKRQGPAGALPGEEDDSDRVEAFLKTWTRDCHAHGVLDNVTLDSDPVDVNRASIHDIIKAREYAASA